MSYAPPVLKVADRGAEVGNLQRFRNAKGHTDRDGRKLKIDEDLGPRTFYALKMFQKRNVLIADGIFGPFTRRIASSQGFIPFVQAANCLVRWPALSRHVTLVVIHTMESPETGGTALGVARWFAGELPRYPAPQASAHYNVDPDSVVQCVRETDIAWHAHGANVGSIGVEHAGRASQDAKGWADQASAASLDRSTRLVAGICSRYEIPAVRLTPEAVKRVEKGICGHVDVTRAGLGGDHTDPGPNFPWASYIERVQKLMKIEAEK